MQSGANPVRLGPILVLDALGQELFGKQGDVLPALTKRRKAQRKHVDPVIQVFAEHRRFLMAAEGPYWSLLSRAHRRGSLHCCPLS